MVIAHSEAIFRCTKGNKTWKQAAFNALMLYTYGRTAIGAILFPLFIALCAASN